MKVALEDAAAHVFRRALEQDRPADALSEAWMVLEGGDPALAGPLLAQLGHAPALVGAAAVTNFQACSVAVTARDGSLRYADERFARWIGEPRSSPACARLVRRAAGGGKAVGLVETLDGGVLAVAAVDRSAAGRWPLDAAARAATARDGSIVLLAFAPSRSGDLVLEAARAFGLTPLEARVAEALLEAPSLDVAADNIGVGRETAKDALGGAMRKAGVQRSSQLLGRIVDLSCGGATPGAPELGATLGLTAAEMRVAVALADGATAGEAARALGLSEQTVKSYRKAIFTKTGVNRARDLRRLMAEAQTLGRFAQVDELTVEEPAPAEQLRVIVGADGRHVAYIDHGPADGRVLLVGHGAATGRKVPARLAGLLQQAGYRPIALQRPGFGLTDVAAADYVDTAAADMLTLLDRLDAPQATLLMREGGGAAAIAFGARWPERLRQGVLLNPRSPISSPVAGATLSDRLSRALLMQPAVIRPFAEMMRRQTRTDLVQATLRHMYAGVVVDRAFVEQPAVMAHLVRDVQGLSSRTVAGFVDEHRAYAEGWRLPGALAGDWTMTWSGELFTEADLAVWRALPGLRMAPLPGAGLLAQFTHPEQLVALLKA